MTELASELAARARPVSSAAEAVVRAATEGATSTVLLGTLGGAVGAITGLLVARALRDQARRRRPGHVVRGAAKVTERAAALRERHHRQEEHRASQRAADAESAAERVLAEDRARAEQFAAERAREERERAVRIAAERAAEEARVAAAAEPARAPADDALARWVAAAVSALLGPATPARDPIAPLKREAAATAERGVELLVERVNARIARVARRLAEAADEREREAPDSR